MSIRLICAHQCSLLSVSYGLFFLFIPFQAGPSGLVLPTETAASFHLAVCFWRIFLHVITRFLYPCLCLFFFYNRVIMCKRDSILWSPVSLSIPTWGLGWYWFFFYVGSSSGTCSLSVLNHLLWSGAESPWSTSWSVWGYTSLFNLFLRVGLRAFS